MNSQYSPIGIICWAAVLGFQVYMTWLAYHMHGDPRVAGACGAMALMALLLGPERKLP